MKYRNPSQKIDQGPKNWNRKVYVSQETEANHRAHLGATKGPKLIEWLPTTLWQFLVPSREIMAHLGYCEWFRTL